MILDGKMSRSMESLAIPAAATTVAASLTPKPPVWSVFGQNHAFDPKFGSFYTGIDVNAASHDVNGGGIDVNGRSIDINAGSHDINGDGIDVNDASIEVIGSGIDVSSRGNDVVGGSINAVVSLNHLLWGGKRVTTTGQGGGSKVVDHAHEQNHFAARVHDGEQKRTIND
jgi:hypothetical protein